MVGYQKSNPESQHLLFVWVLFGDDCLAGTTSLGAGFQKYSPRTLEKDRFVTAIFILFRSTPFQITDKNDDVRL